MLTENAKMERHDNAGAGPCPLPRQMRDYRDYHKDATILVCGCGSSLAQVVSPESFITIGVNDVGRLFHPDYLVVLNPRSQFSGDRFNYVENSKAGAIFTQLNLGISHPNVVRFRLGQRNGTDFNDPESLPYTRNSPYVAVCLAIHMGARRIGLIGVDFTNDHFFARTGQHALARELPQIDREYKRLHEACVALGVELVNLSEQSRLTALPKMSFQEFAALKKRKSTLEIVSYSMTPVAGVPIILSRCISARTSHGCRTVWATNSYGNGVTFESDVEWRRAPSQAEELLRSADLVIVHNGKTSAHHQALLAHKPIVTMAHNYMWNVTQEYVRQGFPGVVVGQYQASLPEFHGWDVVPNPVPLWESGFQPGLKNSEITICYTPSGKHEKYPPGHRLYWHSKGYVTTMRVLKNLARRFPIRLEVLDGRQVSLAESLEMKRRSHVVIDECVTGSYHRNSLEGLAAGCVVVNALGHLPAVAEVFRGCAAHEHVPFTYATLETLERVLEELIGRGADALVEEGKRNRAWMEERWDFGQQWTRFWEPVIDKAFHCAKGLAAARARMPANGHGTEKRETPSQPAACSMSAVICQGGPDRLRQLAASLASLRQCPELDEIIVVDMGTAPFAEDVSRRWADKYFFVKNDEAFERARSLNVGTALARHDLILWLDNDLILPPGFIAKAVTEMRQRNLDFIIPYAQVKYLSESDTRQVIMGARTPRDCPAAGVLKALHPAFGGAGIVKKSFVQAYGGMSEEFRGWGGEDDAWWHKARLLGQAAVTQQPGQHLYHLHHPNSCSYARQKQSNPHYSSNVTVLREVWSIRDREKFLKRFPPPAHVSWSWKNKRVAFISRAAVPDSSTVAKHLMELGCVDVHLRTLADDGPVSAGWIAENPPDAIVLFGMEPAAAFLADEAQNGLWAKTIVVIDSGAISPDAALPLRHAGAIVCTHDSSAAALKQAGLRPWVRPASGDGPSASLQTALCLLQPLSIILGGAVPSSVDRQAAATGVPSTCRHDAPSRLPVWMYWEGDCPEWIRRCRQTILLHGGDVRLLSPLDFKKLWDSDLDVDLDRLHVAQRADFIRAFLLARYGGLWLDSDCIVMRPLQPLIDALERYDFIAHRETTAGLWANDFMGAAPGSRIAAALYRHVTGTLRSRKTIGWTDLGCTAVTHVLNAADAPWLEIKAERIQPVCWNQHAPFLEIRSREQHERVFDRQAICYMLSNLTMQKKLQTPDVSDPLLKPGTFFSYLLDRSMDSASSSNAACEKAPAETLPLQNDLGFTQPMTRIFTQIASTARKDRQESLSGPGSSLLSTEEIRQRLPLMIQDLDVRSLLDAACGDFNWMRAMKLNLHEYVGADLLPEIIEENQRKFAASARRFLTLDVTRDPLPNVDLVLCRDFLVLLSNEEIIRCLRNFKKSGSRYLLATTFVNRQTNSDVATGDWRPLNLQGAPFHFPAPLRIVNEKCAEGGGQYSDKSLALWKIEDLPLPASLNVAPSEAMNAPPDSSAPTSVYSSAHSSTLSSAHPLHEAIESEEVQPYEVAVIVPISVAKGQQDRLRNAEACLAALNAQDLDRKSYRVIVVEQDVEPHLESMAATLADQYVFAYNPGHFNKGWAFNVGASTIASSTVALCLIDADILPPPSFLSAGLNGIRSGQRAIRPYAQITYLDPSSTQQAILDRTGGNGNFAPEKYRGQSFKDSKGGCIWIEPQLYRQICGFDERFRGFGYEDTEFWGRVSKHTKIAIGAGALLHMHHPRTVDRNCSVANSRLYSQIISRRIAAWAGPMGNLDLYADKRTSAASRDAERTRAASTHPSVNGHVASATANGHNGPAPQTLVEVFSEMVAQGSRAGSESLYGPGSSLAQTAEIRQRLPLIVKELGISSFLDAPCGDFNWMRHVDLGVKEYVGIDPLSAVVQRNQENFGTQERKFLNLDFTSDPLPEMDVILCRDCLVHLSYAEIFRILKNFKASRSKYLLTTTFEKRKANADTSGGRWRPLNLRLAPFHFPEPLTIINEKCTEERGRYDDKSLALWLLADTLPAP